MTTRTFDPTSIDASATTTVIEASAGTGKTTAIAALTTRALAEGWCTVDQIMLVTFGRRASTELRTRLHERLSRAIGQLGSAAGSGSPTTTDAWDLLILGDPADRPRRLSRLQDAFRDLDRATIATTHQFCQTMLNELGVLVDHDRQAAFIDDLRDLHHQVLTDTYLQQQAGNPNPMYFSAASRTADVVLNRVEPLQGRPELPRAQAQVELATGLRHGLERRKRVMSVYGFDDMVTRLHHALRAEVAEHDLAKDSSALRARRLLSDRYRWVMIDEYQDTDSLQWEIASAAFSGHSRLLLIGDPKQAIYAFRGADVQAYLRAVNVSSDKRTLVDNWRSGASLVKAVEQLVAGRQLGRDICLPEVTARRADRRLADSSGLVPAVQLRLVTGQQDAVAPAAELSSLIADDLVAQVQHLLGCRYVEPAFDQNRTDQPVEAGEITVLVRTNDRGEELRDALLAAGIQAVFSGNGSVFQSQAATDWLRLLDAIDQPTTGNIRKVALTSFFGHDVPTLSRLDDDQIADIAVAVKDLGQLLERSGVAAAFAEACEQYDVVARLLGQPDGERVVTDLRHLSQLLHDHQRATDCGVTGLVAWLSTRMGKRGDIEEGTRRLESDRGAVQVMTIHRAKGLDLPIVLVPEAATWAPYPGKGAKPVVVHDGQGRALIDVSPSDATKAQAAEQEADEELRLLYVAITRAKYALRVWWVPSGDRTTRSPLHRLLASPRDTGSTPALQAKLDDRPAKSIRSQWASTLWNPVVVSEPPQPSRAALAARSGVIVDTRTFTRVIDHDWRRTSYSALTSSIHELPGAASLVVDEPDLEVDTGPGSDSGSEDDRAADPLLALAADADRCDPIVSPMASFPGGVLFGTLVHAVLEELDPQAADLSAELLRASALALTQTPMPEISATELSAGLELVVSTPLGELAQGRRLRDYPGADRLTELDFELPLATSSTHAGTVGDLARAFTQHLPANDLLADYGRRLAETEAAQSVLAGWLTGSIDAVLRHRDDGQVRHLVVDYKTNRMPVQPGEELTVQHYGPQVMAEAMMAAHYPLQALLYCVALHRFLRHRLPGYDPDVHLGGVGYLFVRGMAGDQVGQPSQMPWGVFTWHPPTALVVHADRIVSGLAPGEEGAL